MHLSWFGHALGLWPVEQSSILYAKFDFPVALTVHDCDTDWLLLLFAIPKKIDNSHVQYFSETNQIQEPIIIGPICCL